MDFVRHAIILVIIKERKFFVVCGFIVSLMVSHVGHSVSLIELNLDGVHVSIVSSLLVQV